MPILVFVPGEKSDHDGVRKRIADAECSVLLDRCEVETRGVRNGPGSQDGLVLAGFSGSCGDAERQVGYWRDSQAWQKIPWADVWTGIPNDGLDPDTLLREDVYDSHAMRLADGRRWKIPIVRLFPQLFTYAESGALQAEPTPRCATVFKAVWSVLEGVTADGDSTVPYEDLLRVCSDLLALNYRVDRFSGANLLRIWDQTAMINTVMAAVDAPGLERLIEDQKKSPLSDPGGGQSTPDGEMDGSTDTAPQPQTSDSQQ